MRPKSLVFYFTECSRSCAELNTYLHMYYCEHYLACDSGAKTIVLHCIKSWVVHQSQALDMYVIIVVEVRRLIKPTDMISHGRLNTLVYF